MDIARIPLEKFCDISKVEQLHEQLEARLRAGAAVEIDASAVERIDTSTLQLLAACLRTLEQHHLEGCIVAPSACFSATARMMGLAGALKLSN